MLDKKWTFALKPLDDETLDSLFIRFAIFHGLKPSELLSIIFGENAKKTRELEYSFYTGRALQNKSLTETFGVSDQRFKKTLDWTLLKDFGNWTVYHSEPDWQTWKLSGVITGIIRMKIATRNQCGFQFCDSCFREDKIPYFRRKWKLSFNTICEKHNKLLQDTCPNCNNYITLWVSSYKNYLDEFYMINDAVCVCNCCGYDLRSKNNKANTHNKLQITDLQRGLHRSFDRGWIEVSNNIKVYPELFFPVFYRLLRLFSFQSEGDYLKAACEYLKLSVPDIFNLKTKNFDSLNTTQRHQIIKIVCNLISNFPERLIHFSRKYYIFNVYQLEYSNGTMYWYGDFFKNIEYIPYWFWSAVMNNLVRSDEVHDWEYDYHEFSNYYRRKKVTRIWRF